MTRVYNVLAFINVNLGRLEDLASFWKEGTGDPFIRLVDKILIECALMVMLASRIEGLPGETVLLISQLKEKLARFIFTERNRFVLRRYPKLCGSLGGGIIYLHEMGVIDEDLYRLVKESLDGNYPETGERIPFRMMDLRWMRGLVHPETKPDFSDLVNLSILSSRAHPIYMDNMDAYAVTHALMYITDFGSRPVKKPAAPFDYDHVSQMVDDAIAWHMMSEDIDLLAEFLINAALLGRFLSPYARFAWFLINKAWDELGFLPGPGFKAADFARLSGDEASAYAFQYLYHTNVVGGILCSVLLGGCAENPVCDFIKPGHAEIQAVLPQAETAIAEITQFLQRNIVVDRPESHWSKRQPGENFVPGAGDFLNHNLSADPTPFEKLVGQALSLGGIAGKPGAFWIRCISDAPLADGELIMVLSDGLLIQSAREYNLAMVTNILKDLGKQNAPVTHTILEAVNFLGMQSGGRGWSQGAQPPTSAQA